MRKQFITSLAVCAACVALGARAQNSTSGAAPGSSTDNSADQTTGQSGYGPNRHYGSSGRMGHQDVRVSKIMGAEIKDNQGQSIGTINDIIINPASGRLDFAVVSLGSTLGNASTESPSIGTPSTPPSTTATSSANTSAGKQVPVPWVLLRPAAMASTTTTTSSSTVGQPSFVFAGDTSKIQSAPSLDQSTDITQFSWRQSIYGHFGMTPGSATGGASSPGGTESSTGAGSSTMPPAPDNPSPDSSNPSK